MPKHLKKLSEEIIHENPWTQYKHDTYEVPNGSEGNYYYVECPGMVKVVPVLPDGRIVLTLQHRYLQDKQSIEFPAGGVDVEEIASESAVREVLEETGYKTEELTKVGNFEPSNGLSKNEAHVYIASVSGDQGEQVLESTEDIEVLYRRPDEVEDMIRRGDIWDGATLAVWALVRHRFLEQTDS
jgi:ADP-ribose pyrophosphatase